MVLRILVWTSVAERPVLDALDGVDGVEARAASSREAFLEGIAAADGVVMMGGFQSYTAEVADRIAKSPTLKWLQLISAGYEGVEAHGAPAHIQLTGPGEGISSAVAEHAMALLWALARGIGPSVQQQGEARWDRDLARRMMTLEDRTLLVLGMGTIGRKTARLARALGMKVIGVSHSGSPAPEPHDVRPVSELAELLPQAHAIVLALPLKPGTRNILDAETLALCRKGALVVNVGRGELIDQPALIAALKSGQIGGAGLDVTTPEPPAGDDPIWTTPGVIITPHVGGAGDPAALRSIIAAIAENARRLQAGEPLLNPVALPRD